MEVYIDCPRSNGHDTDKFLEFNIADILVPIGQTIAGNRSVNKTLCFFDGYYIDTDRKAIIFKFFEQEEI
jgi:hypothetical protein